MKTTVEVSDALLAEAKQEAVRRGTTLRTMIEEGLRHELESKQRAGSAFRLRDGSFRGRGINPEFAGTSWETVRDAIYEGHGA